MKHGNDVCFRFYPGTGDSYIFLSRKFLHIPTLQVHSPRFTHHLPGMCPGEDWGCTGWHALQRRTSQSQGLAFCHSEVFQLQSPMCCVKCVSRPWFLPLGVQKKLCPAVFFLLCALLDLVKPVEWTNSMKFPAGTDDFGRDAAASQEWQGCHVYTAYRELMTTLIIILATLTTMFEATSHSGIPSTPLSNSMNLVYFSCFSIVALVWVEYSWVLIVESMTSKCQFQGCVTGWKSRGDLQSTSGLRLQLFLSRPSAPSIGVSGLQQVGSQNQSDLVLAGWQTATFLQWTLHCGCQSLSFLNFPKLSQSEERLFGWLRYHSLISTSKLQTSKPPMFVWFMVLSLDHFCTFRSTHWLRNAHSWTLAVWSIHSFAYRLKPPRLATLMHCWVE